MSKKYYSRRYCFSLRNNNRLLITDGTSTWVWCREDCKSVLSVTPEIWQLYFSYNGRRMIFIESVGEHQPPPVWQPSFGGDSEGHGTTVIMFNDIIIVRYDDIRRSKSIGMRVRPASDSRDKWIGSDGSPSK